MPNSKQIVYLSQSQYADLIANGSITVDGVTVTYDENDIYVTPQAEPVTDVRINGTSVSNGGIANVPIADENNPGVVKVKNLTSGLRLLNNSLEIIPAVYAQAKAGTESIRPIVPLTSNYAAFYGLAKAAGHDEKNSTESIGTYTPEAKGAIQQMLGVSDLIATAENTLVASKAYTIGDIFTANGKLYKVTAAIAANDSIVLQNSGETVSGANAEEIKLSDYAVHDVQVNGTSIMQNGVANVPYANGYAPGVMKVSNNGAFGASVVDGQLYLIKATDARIKDGIYNYQPIVPSNQHLATFYGLAKAAGDTTQSQSANAVGTYTDDAKSAIRTMLGAVGDVQINETSIVSNGIAEIPVATSSTFGAIKVSSGLYMTSGGELRTNSATAAVIKNGVDDYRPIVSSNLNTGVFYGLAKASGDTTQSASSNAVGVYTDNAKASIKAMLGIQDGSTGTVDVSGTTPTITAVENTRYVCGEVTSLDFTPAASGICIVRFTSGSSVTVLTLPSTVKFPEWFDPTSLETNTIYEICITDGVYGAVMSWAQ